MGEPTRIEQPECVILSDQPSDAQGDAAVPSRSTTKKRSLVWTYFRESVIDKEAICKEKLSTSGNTAKMN